MNSPIAMFGIIRKTVWLFLLLVLYVTALAEISSRIYLAFAFEVPLFRPDKIAFRIYPKLKDVLEVPTSSDDGYFDILLLGGSALTEEYGSIEKYLRQKGRKVFTEPVRIHNVSTKAHTTRDSVFKYESLRDASFDLVILYHGINDLRLNYCELQMYSPDYSHLRWYDEINRFFRHPEIKYFSLPYLIDHMVLVWKTKAGKVSYAPEFDEISGEQWREYGFYLKNLKQFEDNIARILAMAAERGEEVILPTYAFYVPADYSLEKFRAKSLDYGEHTLPIEIYGEKEQLKRYLSAYNEKTSALCKKYENVRCVDINARIPKDAGHFDDVCHLTDRGSELFVDLLLGGDGNRSSGEGK